MTQNTLETDIRESQATFDASPLYIVRKSKDETSAGLGYLRLIRSSEFELSERSSSHTSSVQDIKEELVFGVATEATDETVGSSYASNENYVAGLFAEARQILQQCTESDVALEADKVLVDMQAIVSAVVRDEFKLATLPPLHAVNVDDGSVLLEWIFRNFRIGFTIEPNPEESAWYLVSNANLGEITASGYMHGQNRHNIISWLTYFVVSGFWTSL